MAEQVPYEKTYHEWLQEALARDEDTWAAFEERLSRLRRKRSETAAAVASAAAAEKTRQA